MKPQLPNAQSVTDARTRNTRPGAFAVVIGHWYLVIHWSLVIGQCRSLVIRIPFAFGIAIRETIGHNSEVQT